MNRTTHKLKFAVFGNIHQARKSAAISKILSCLRERDVEVCIEREFFEFLKRNGQLPDGPSLMERYAADVIDCRRQTGAHGDGQGSRLDADFVISMGGDGTLLKSAMHVGDRQIPIIGINMGRLGFLASITPDDIDKAFDAIFRGKYFVEDHSVIEVKADGGTLETYPCALNDIAVLKRDNASMISIRVAIDGEYLVTYRADGLIISTPTGSTAYSLSNGGPIIVPDTGVLCLTPVAPHSLNIRPIVIPDTSRITLSVESRSHNYLVAVDGRSEKCAETVGLEISKAAYCVKTVKCSDTKYIGTLRDKMMWGADNRGMKNEE